MALNNKTPVWSLSENLKGIFDPVELLKSYPKKEKMLLESADIVTKLGEKSLALFDLAIKVEARQNQVFVSALLKEAESVLSLVAVELAEFLVERKDHSLCFAFAPLIHEADLEKKMRKPSPLDALRSILAAILVKNHEMSPVVMLSGMFSYDFLDHFEELASAQNDLFEIPQFVFYLPLTIVSLHHPEQKTIVYAHALGADEQEAKKRAQLRLDDMLKKIAVVKKENAQFKVANVKEQPLSYEVDTKDNEFCALVEKCQSHIKSGDVYQIVPSRTFSLAIKNSYHSYQTLRVMNPSPYMFFAENEDFVLFGSSPETFVKVDHDTRMVSVRPIAGTRRRGKREDGSIDEELDAREQASLCLDEKELAEHMMLVDLARNDVASVCKPGSRRVKRLLGVDRFSHVMHLVSEVEGELLADFDALSAYQSSMNMGTLMGAPKVRAAQLLREYEKTKRGFYGGAIGYFNQAGGMDMAIIIRAALVKDNIAYIRAGCGVVLDSVASFEAQETINKAEAVIRAVSSTFEERS